MKPFAAASNYSADQQGTVSANFRRAPPSVPLGGAPKRAMDIAIALCAITLLLPLLVIITGLIKLTMGGPTIFAHPRVGYNGKLFKCYKFRTMVRNAEEALRLHLANDPKAAEEWHRTRKLRSDPRVTVLGHLLRKSSLDELPQLINVLRGEMSCVGPRPIVLEELQEYGASSEDYFKARPGLTGIWQVSGRSNVNYARRVALDCAYIRNWSIWGDIIILAKTVFVLTNFDETA
ncbi:MAG: sugar transferase [Pseudorhodoplanes sp.]|jgi:exopolysaccharide production protein ExoY|nr:sugar transferase [Pseudorhodoplanes sp.]